MLYEKDYVDTVVFLCDIVQSVQSADALFIVPYYIYNKVYLGGTTWTLY